MVWARIRLMAENLLANVDRQLGQELTETALERNRPKLWARRLCRAKALYEENSAPNLMKGRVLYSSRNAKSFQEFRVSVV